MLTLFGSINLDISIQVPRLPEAGETLLGSRAFMSPGGKGANQAHAARLFGVDTRLIGAVGDDAFAERALANLRQAGVDLSGVRAVPKTDTGLASVSVVPGGENAIVVAPGANSELRADWVSGDDLARTSLLLLQMEAPEQETMKLARRAMAADCPVMLNAAPVPGEAIEPGCISWLVVNKTELSQLCKARGFGGSHPSDLAARLARDLSADVIVTLGSEGAVMVANSGRRVTCKALHGHVVDTTGAGDTFTGVFAAALASGFDASVALQHAVVAAGLACRRVGAQVAQPTREEVLAGLAEYSA